MKTLTRDEARVQAKRLQVSPVLAPQSAEGRKEVVDCLMRNCEDIEHAERAMTAALDGCVDPRNFAAELAIAAKGTRKSNIVLPEPCPECPEDDYVPFERNGYSGVGRHNCARGLALRERDRNAWQQLESTRKRASNEVKFSRVAEVGPGGDAA